MGAALAILRRHEDAWPFRDPVSRAEVPDYYDIIRVGRRPANMSDTTAGIINPKCMLRCSAHGITAMCSIADCSSRLRSQLPRPSCPA